jgi:hypothetical protein
MLLFLRQRGRRNDPRTVARGGVDRDDGCVISEPDQRGVLPRLRRGEALVAVQLYLSLQTLTS